MSVGYLSSIENYQKQIEQEVVSIKGFCLSNIFNGTVKDKVNKLFEEFLKLQKESNSESQAKEKVRIIVLKDKNFKVIEFNKDLLILRDNFFKILEDLTSEDSLELQNMYDHHIRTEKMHLYLFNDVFKLAQLKINRESLLKDKNFDEENLFKDIAIFIENNLLSYTKDLVEVLKKNKLYSQLLAMLSEAYLNFHLYEEAFFAVQKMKDSFKIHYPEKGFLSYAKENVHINNARALAERRDIEGLGRYCKNMTSLYLRAVGLGYINQILKQEEYRKNLNEQIEALNEQIKALKVDVLKKLPKSIEASVAIAYVEKILENPTYISKEKINLDEEIDREEEDNVDEN